MGLVEYVKNRVLAVRDLARQSQLRWTPLPVAAWVAILVGAWLRSSVYLANRSLWIDEAALALNIVKHSFSGLVPPLLYNQVAPIGFLIAEKIAITPFGNTEFSLRLVPQLAGLLSLILFYKTARRCLRLRAALLALTMFALSTSMIYFASEVKPYSVDVAATLAILLLGFAVAERGGEGILLIAFGVVGAAAVLMSYPSVFVLAACALVLMADDWFRRGGSNVGKIAGLAGCWAAVFLVTYLEFTNAPTAYLLDFWKAGFLPSGTFSLETLRQIVHMPFNALDPNTLGLSPFWLARAAFILGCVSLLRANSWQFAFLLSPIAITFLTALMHLYPFVDRLILFLVPLYLIVIAAGLDFIWEWIPLVGFFPAVCLAGVLVFCATRSALSSMRHPPGREEIKPVLDFIIANEKQGDLLYVYYGARPAFDFYTQFSERYRRLGDTGIVYGRGRTRDDAQYEEDLRRLCGHPRVWVVMSHKIVNRTSSTVDEAAIFRSILDRLGKRESEVNMEGACAYLYDMTRPVGLPKGGQISAQLYSIGRRTERARTARKLA